MYVIIVGCGRVGSALAKLLSKEGHNVVVVDKAPSAFHRLGRRFNGITLVGSGFDVKALKEAGVEKADAVCCLTNGDNTNIMSSQIAKKMFNVPKVIARIYDPYRAEIYQELGLSVISGTVLFAAMIRDKLIEEKLSTFLTETSDISVLEIEATEAIANKTIGQLNIPMEFMIVSLAKKSKKPIIPDSTVKIDKGDTIVGVVKISSLPKIKKNLGVNH